MVTPRWDERVPFEVRQALEPHLSMWLPLLPSLYQELRVRWEGELDSTLVVNTHVPNRWCVLTVGPAFLSQPLEEREVAVLHELVHAVWADYTDTVTHLVEELTQEGSRERAVVEAVLLRAAEACTEDAARGIRHLVARALHAPARS